MPYCKENESKEKLLTTDHISHKAVRNECREVPAYYIKNHHLPIVSRATFDRVQKILQLRSQGSCAGRTGSKCIQYPLGQMLKCPYCGSPLYQRSLFVQAERGKAWCCEVGEGACRNFVIRSKNMENAILHAYEMLDVEDVVYKDKTEKSVKAVQKNLAMKKAHPVFTRVDYYWVDDLIDHIEIGPHCMESTECLRKEITEGNYVDDRTVSVFWKCGMKTTVFSGIERERDMPQYIAGIYCNYLEQHGDQRKKAQEQVRVEQAGTGLGSFVHAIEVSTGISSEKTDDMFQGVLEKDDI